MIHQSYSIPRAGNRIERGQSAFWLCPRVRNRYSAPETRVKCHLNLDETPPVVRLRAYLRVADRLFTTSFW